MERSSEKEERERENVTNYHTALVSQREKKSRGDARALHDKLPTPRAPEAACKWGGREGGRGEMQNILAAKIWYQGPVQTRQN